MDPARITARGLLRWEIRRQYERAFRKVALKESSSHNVKSLTPQGEKLLASETLPANILEIIQKSKPEDRAHLREYANALHHQAKKVAKLSRSKDTIITPFGVLSYTNSKQYMGEAFSWSNSAVFGSDTRRPATAKERELWDFRSGLDKNVELRKLRDTGKHEIEHLHSFLARNPTKPEEYLIDEVISFATEKAKFPNDGPFSIQGFAKFYATHYDAPHLKEEFANALSQVSETSGRIAAKERNKLACILADPHIKTLKDVTNILTHLSTHPLSQAVTHPPFWVEKVAQELNLKHLISVRRDGFDLFSHYEGPDDMHLVFNNYHSQNTKKRSVVIEGMAARPILVHANRELSPPNGLGKSEEEFLTKLHASLTKNLEKKNTHDK